MNPPFDKPQLKDGEPCSHAGCLSHVSHPCEGCGRIAGKPVTKSDSAAGSDEATPFKGNLTALYQGSEAAREDDINNTLTDCPYDPGTQAATDWYCGYRGGSQGI